MARHGGNQGGWPKGKPRGPQTPEHIEKRRGAIQRWWAESTPEQQLDWHVRHNVSDETVRVMAELEDHARRKAAG